MSKLFEPFKLGAIELPNRIVIAPKCQYSAQDGCMTDWHLIHPGHLGMSGAALLTIEATAVSTEGRITYADVGLYSTETEASIGRTIESIRRHSPIAIGIQLGHAGRKASTEVPWLGGAQIAPDAPNGWTTVAPSAIPFASGQISPVELTHQQMKGIRQGFVGAAQRAVQLGIDLIQLHAAHGYLLHQFLSPISNRREDEYGGSYENRIRFPLEVFDAVREAVPPGYPVGVRASGTGGSGAGAKNSDRPELSGTTCACDQVRNQHSCGCSWIDYRVRTGRSDRQHGRRGFRRTCSRYPLRPAVALARGRVFRRTGQGTEAVFAI